MKPKIISCLVLAIFTLSLVTSAASWAAPLDAGTSNRAANVAKKVVKASFDPACLETAVEKRENAIIAALDTFHTAVKKALETRRDALKNAWKETDRTKRRQAIKAAWTAYRKSLKDARKALNAAKRAAWKQFASDVKTCLQKDTTGARYDDSTTSSEDTNL